jgi:hypothetical protein
MTRTDAQTTQTIPRLFSSDFVLIPGVLAVTRGVTVGGGVT